MGHGCVSLWPLAIRHPARWLRAPFSVLYKMLKTLAEILTGIDLPCEAEIGRRFRIDHFGGIVISGDAVLGEDCIVRNGVTIGLRHTGQRGSPVIGNRVDIGAGAKILGADPSRRRCRYRCQCRRSQGRASELDRGRRTRAQPSPQERGIDDRAN